MGAGANATILYNRDWRIPGRGTAIVRFDRGDPIGVWFGARLLLNQTKEINTRTVRNVEIGADTRSERLVSNAATVTFDVPRELTVTFALPHHPQALEALDACARNLGVKWGYSVEEQGRLATPPKEEQGLGVFEASDYPAAAVNAGQMGRAHVRVRVGESGAIAECTILRSSGSAELDSTTCKVINERAKFEPARDVAGNAIRGVVMVDVRWELRM